MPYWLVQGHSVFPRERGRRRPSARTTRLRQVVVESAHYSSRVPWLWTVHGGIAEEAKLLQQPIVHAAERLSEQYCHARQEEGEERGRLDGS